jgi:hypothetical protein
MRRTVVLLLVLFAMLWQNAALARPGSTMYVLADLEHAALHWQEEGHHHHDDGSYHVDDSNESVQHVIADHVTASAAIMGSTDQDFPSAPSDSPSGLHERPAPHPFLDGLLRPPRLRS